MNSLFLKTLIALFIAVAGCDAQTSNELSRKTASDLLGSWLKSKSVTHLALSRDGIERGVSSGILQKNFLFDMVTGYSLTASGKKLVEGITKPEYPFSPGQNPSFVLRTPIREQLSEVTGITAGPMPGVMIVEYTTDFILPQELGVIRQYIFTGRADKAGFQKYDDGWRIMEN